MIFFLARLAEEAIRADLSSDLLYFMSTKISRRLRKLGPPAPGWLTEAVLDTCSRVREVLDDRWEQVQVVQRASPPHVFSELNFANDMRLSLRCSREYLAKGLHSHETEITSGYGGNFRRGSRDPRGLSFGLQRHFCGQSDLCEGHSWPERRK